MHKHVENIYIHDEFLDTPFIVLSGPSAGGKTFLSKKLPNFNDKITLLIKHTDRSPRHGELDGVNYFFVSTSSFKKILMPKTAMLSVSRYGHFYGLLCKEVSRALLSNTIPLFILDTHAAVKFKKVYKKTILIFVAPSIELVKERIANRLDNNREKAKRLELIEEEYNLKKYFDYILDNDYNENNIMALIDIIKEVNINDFE